MKLTVYCVITFLHFSYTAIKSVDDTFGSRDIKTGEWSGMIGMIVGKVGKWLF